MLPTFAADPRDRSWSPRPIRAPEARSAFRGGLRRADLRHRSRRCATIRRSRRSTSRRRIRSTPRMSRSPPRAASMCWSKSRWRSRSTECRAMIDAARRAGVQLVVGHSHSFDAPILHARETDRQRRLRRGAHDPRAQLHRFPVPAAPAGGTRHRARRRRDLQPGRASDRHRAAARRRAGAQRARR